MPRHRTSQARRRTTAAVATSPTKEYEDVNKVHTRCATNHERFKHNFHVGIVLFPALLVITWNVDFATRMFMGYGMLVTMVLDLLDVSREYAVVSLGMFTSFALLAMWVNVLFLQSSTWNLVLAQQMTLVLLLSGVFAVLQFPWVWNVKMVPLRYAQMLEQVLLQVLPFPSSTLLVWQLIESLPAQTFDVYCFAQCGVFVVYWASCCTKNNALLLAETMITLMNPCLFAVANRSKYTYVALLIRTAYLTVLPQFFKFEFKNLKTNTTRWSALCCVIMALVIDPTTLLAAMSACNAMCNVRSLKHWFTSLIAWSFSLAAVTNPNQVRKSCAVLFACYALCALAWYTQQHNKKALVVIVLCVCTVSWEITHTWQVIGMVVSLVLAGIVQERSQAGLFTSAVMFALQAERSAITNWEHQTSYLIITTLIALVISSGLAYHQAALSLITLQQHTMLAKFAVVAGFLRFLYPVHAVILAVCSLVLMLTPWQEYFAAVVAIEVGLCFANAYYYSSNAAAAAVLCIVIVSASIVFQSHQFALLQSELRALPLRCVLAVLLILPMLSSTDSTDAIMYLCLVALGLLASMLDVFEDWIILLAAFVFSLPANPLVSAIVVGALSFCLVKPYFAHGRRVKAVGLCLLICYCCSALAVEEGDLRFIVFCLAVMCTLSHYCHHRERTLRELNFAFQMERECTLLFTCTYCLLVVCITAASTDFSSPFTRSCAAFALFFTVFPFELKCRLVLAMQILLQAATTTFMWNLIGLFLFFAITELYFADKNRLLFASPFLAVLVYLQPYALGVSACTLITSLAVISLLQTRRIHQPITSRMHQTL